MDYDLYLMPIAWWILNHEKYDPEYDPQKWKTVFRGNILNVTDDNIEALITNINVDRLNIEELKSFVPNISSDFRRFIFFVDFDSRLYVDSFFDIDLGSYLPDSKWEYKFENPIKYLPEELAHIVFSMGIVD